MTLGRGMWRETQQVGLLLPLLLLVLCLHKGTPAIFEFTPPEKDPYLQATTGKYWWKVYPISHEECQHCGDRKLNPLCDKNWDSVPPVNRSNDPNMNEVCIRFHTKHPPTTAAEVLEKLGRGAVINFIGDSNTRLLFMETLAYFGYPNYMHNLYEVAKLWKDKNTRKTIDHTNLCAWSLPHANNITLSFSWSRFTSKYHDFFAKRPWSRCKGSCRIADDVEKNGPFCDGSSVEGVDLRWTCGSTLDSVQIDEMEGHERSFITVSQVSVHDSLHVYHGNTMNLEDFYAKPPNKFKVGDVVRGNFRGEGRYYGGSIVKVHEGDQETTYDIKYSVDFEERVPRSRIRISDSGWSDVVYDIEEYFKSLGTRGKDKNDFVRMDGKNAKEVENLTKGLLSDHANKSCWMSSAYRGGKEIMMSPLHLRREAGGPSLKGADIVLQIMRESIIKNWRGVFDDFIDPFSISGTDVGAPSPKDGIHYPTIMYRAEIEMLMSSLIGKKDISGVVGKSSTVNGSSGIDQNNGGYVDKDADSSSKSGAGNYDGNSSNDNGSHSSMDYKSLYEQSIQELKQLEDEA